MRRPALCAAVLLMLASMAQAAAPEPVTLQTSDGFTLKGDLWRAADPKAPVAILLHQFNADRRSFAKLVPALEEQGFTVLALDQRGQGGSTHQERAGTDRTVRIQELPSSMVGAMVKAGPLDVTAAIAFLKQQGLATDRIALVGSSYGCSVALLATKNEKSIRAAALLSPGSGYFGVDVLPAAKAYGGGLFAIAAADDPVASAPGSARQIADVHEGREQLIIYPNGGHGVAMLDAHPELAPAIAKFLKESLEQP